MSISTPVFPGQQAPSSPVLGSPIVSTQWLCDHLGSDGLVVLDVSTGLGAGAVPAAGRLVGHIPGTVVFDEQAEGLIIAGTKTVILHDLGDGRRAARLWWVLRSIGFDNVAVLSGGIAKWNAEERPLEMGATASLRPERAAGSNGSARERTLVARPELWADPPLVADISAGSVDGVLLEASSGLIDPATGAFLTRRSLADRFRTVLDRRNPCSPIVIVDRGNETAFVDALALTSLGEVNVRVYEGSITVG